MYEVEKTMYKDIDKLELAKYHWRRFADVPINDRDEILKPFMDFPIGTDRFEIWHWFEEEFGVSVAKDLMGIE